MASISSEIRLTAGQQKGLLQLRNNISRTRQERGRELFRSNSTLSFKENEPPLPGHREFVAVIRGSQRYEVFLNFTSGGEVDADCSCEDESVCKHAYCASQTLLSRARVEEPEEMEASLPFVAELETAHGRKLSAPEIDYLERLRTVFGGLQNKEQLTVWDFKGLLPAQFGRGNTPVELWPEEPATVEEFWLYLGNAIQARGLHFPAFMLPVSDFSRIAGKFHDWLRRQEVEKWRQSFEELAAIPLSAQPVPVDLRLHFEVENFGCEARWAGQGDFAPLRASQVRHLQEDLLEGSMALSEAGRIFWHFLQEQLPISTSFSYAETALHPILEQLLRMPVLRPNLVGLDQLPLDFSAEPLRWQLAQVEDGNGDYEMQLVTAAGAPPLRILAQFGGRPPLYLTVRTVYSGPPVREKFTSGERFRIPKEAVESPAGIKALLQVEAPLPPAIAARVRRIPLQLRLSAALVKERQSSSEHVHLEAVAIDAAGQDQRRLTGHGWTSGDKKPVPANGAEMLEIFDEEALGGAERMLDTLPASFDGSLQRWVCKVTRKFPEQFAEWLQSLPPTVELLLDPALASLQASPLIATLDLEIEEAGMDWFDLRTALKIEDTSLTREEISLLLKAGGEYVRLGAKGWRKLAVQISAEENDALSRIGLGVDDLNGEPQRLHVLQLASKAARRLFSSDLADRLEIRASELKTAVTPPIPAAIVGHLRPYQVEGFHFLAYLSSNRFGGLLADDMGLGKTLQTLAWLAWLREQPENAARTTLVVCPKSVTDNWVGESARFYAGLRVGLWREKSSEELRQFVRDFDLVVINYAQLRVLETTLQKIKWLAVILDEGQFIKNPASQTARAACSLRSEHRLILTGTPIENRLLDLWSLMSFAMPGVLGKQSRFQVVFNEKKDPLATRRLAVRMRPFLLRRTKKEVATDLPDRVEEDLICEMEGPQLTRYRAELKLARQYLLKIQTSKQLDQSRFNILASLLRLRQICAHPVLADATLAEAASAKEDALYDLLEPLLEEGHKVLVFSQFVTMLTRLQAGLAERDWKQFYLAGDTENRGPLVQEFQTHPGSAVFLISLRAGGFGLNLTSASYVVLYDPWWNPAVENQAIDRTHRIGQVNKVIAYRLITKDSIEEKIRALQKSKGALAQDILGEENFVRSLTLDDFRYLFDAVESGGEQGETQE